MVDEPLKVAVDGPSVIVSMLGTDFSVTYQKQSGNFILGTVKATETHTYYSVDGERLTSFSISPGLR